MSGNGDREIIAAVRWDLDGSITRATIADDESTGGLVVLVNGEPVKAQRLMGTVIVDDLDLAVELLEAGYRLLYRERR